jgi:hypothetical protein
MAPSTFMPSPDLARQPWRGPGSSVWASRARTGHSRLRGHQIGQGRSAGLPTVTVPSADPPGVAIPARQGSTTGVSGGRP